MLATSIRRTQQTLGRKLLSAVQSLDFPLVVETVKQGADVNHRGIHGDTALQQLIAIVSSIAIEVDTDRLRRELTTAKRLVQFLIEKGAHS